MRISLAVMAFGLVVEGTGIGAGRVGAAQATGGGSAAAQQTASQPTPADAIQTLQVYSRETVVDVTVVNSKGESVTGLTKADFTLLEDGKPQPIRGFQEYGKATPPVIRMPPQLPPNVYTNLQPAPTTSAVNIILLDALNTAAADQVFMKQETLKYLKSMPPGTRVAIMGLSSRLRLLQGFTSDPKILQAVVDSKKNRSMPSPFIDTDTGDALESAMDAVDDATAASLQEFENEQNAFQTDMRNRMTLEALNQIAAYMSGVKGRKNLIWFTAGMPLQMFPQGGVGDMALMTDYSKDLRKTTDMLTQAQIAVYPVDARGLFNNPSNSAANAGKGFASGKGNSMANDNAAFLQKTAGEQLGMQAVAEATGGVAYYNTNGLKEAVGKAIENGANYYTLSYVPPNPAFDGAFHSISVKVNKPNVQLHYRTGYYADDVARNQMTPGLTLATTAPEPYGSNMDASMGRGVPTSSQILFTVGVLPVSDTVNPPDMKVQGMLDPKLTGKPLRRYRFSFSMPGQQVTVTDAPEGKHKAALVFDLASYDVYGKLITKLSQSLNIQLTTEQYKALQTKPVQVTQDLDLPVGEQFVRVGILDANSDKVGTVEIPLVVAKKSSPEAASAGGNGSK
jgi:VWFA-related protein